MPELHTLMTGPSFRESSRSYHRTLWFPDVGANEVVVVDLDGKSEVVARVREIPMDLGWPPMVSC